MTVRSAAQRSVHKDALARSWTSLKNRRYRVLRTRAGSAHMDLFRDATDGSFDR
jgi:hypothetical protein